MVLGAGVRGVMQGMWNLEHTADGFLGYEPTQLLLTFAIAAIAVTAGVYRIVRSRST